MLKITKQDIHYLPIEHWSGYTIQQIEDAAQVDPLHPLALWLLPQLVAWFGSWTVLENGRDMVIHNCDTPLKRVLYMLSRVNRSTLVKSQSSAPQYGTFTPLIALGLKRMQGISYEFWRGFQGREWILEPRLLEAVDQSCPDLGSDRLLEIRTQGLTARTGAKAGQLKNAATTWSLTGIQDTELGHLPKLTQTMLTQCWLAHPTKRCSDMILDPQDWDIMPQPLQTAEIFTVEEPKLIATKQKPAQALPWD